MLNCFQLTSMSSYFCWLVLISVDVFWIQCYLLWFILSHHNVIAVASADLLAFKLKSSAKLFWFPLMSSDFSWLIQILLTSDLLWFCSDIFNLFSFHVICSDFHWSLLTIVRFFWLLLIVFISTDFLLLQLDWFWFTPTCSDLCYIFLKALWFALTFIDLLLFSFTPSGFWFLLTSSNILTSLDLLWFP